MAIGRVTTPARLAKLRQASTGAGNGGLARAGEGVSKGFKVGGSCGSLERPAGMPTARNKGGSAAAPNIFTMSSIAAAAEETLSEPGGCGDGAGIQDVTGGQGEIKSKPSDGSIENDEDLMDFLMDDSNFK